MVDPAWSCFVGSSGEHEFPPFGQAYAGRAPALQEPRRLARIAWHLGAPARAIISKPVGPRCSIPGAAATPLVMLEPFGEYEAKNASLWRAMGFGVPFEECRARVCPTSAGAVAAQPAALAGGGAYYVESWYPGFRSTCSARPA